MTAVEIKQIHDRVWERHESTNPNYIDIVEEKLQVLLHLIGSLAKDKIEADTRTLWIEPLVFKFCYHCTTIIKLFRGIELPIYINSRPIQILDEPSIIILARAALENYLTFFYLYKEPVTPGMTQFRFDVWEYCGRKQRLSFEVHEEELRLRQEEERPEVDKLKQKIQASIFFQGLSSNQKNKILNGYSPRLSESWPALIRKSQLSIKLFKNLYGYKSNYSHSEFLSVLQIKRGGYGYNRETSNNHYLLIIVQGLICTLIFDLAKQFPSVATHLDELNRQLGEEIWYWAFYISNHQDELEE